MIKYSINNSRVVFFFLAVLLIGGVIAFEKMGKKEDAPFIIKQAVIFAHYPGASAEEVEQKVVTVIERKLQTMPNVDKISSDSYLGMAKISIELKPYTPPDEIPQMWDIMRRKLLNVQGELPQGAGYSVNDDFGDVYGIYFSLVAGDGYDYDDLRVWSKKIERELSTVDGVQQVTLFGLQQEVVNATISISKLSTLNITPDEIARVIASQNQLVSPGRRDAGGLQIEFYADGIYTTLEDIKNQVIITNSNGEVRLGDIADITLGYSDTPSTMMFVDGKKAISIAVSSPSDRDVVKTGENVWKKLGEMEREMPVGLDIVSLYAEDKIAAEANIGFIYNLIASVMIVIVLLMFTMGIRPSILIGSSLIFSISGTMFIMQYLEVGLNRTSLAGFIIAMGMLVDNAIVVVDNTQNNMRRGMSKRDAIISGASTPMWGLLGATLIAIFSFLPLYLAKASVAEIVKPLFVVIGVSLLLSWILALSQTTSFAMFILKQKSENERGESKELYTGRLYTLFERALRLLIRFRYATIISMVGILLLSLYVMGRMPQNFFPNLDKEYFRAEFFLPNGYSINQTKRHALEMTEWLEQQEAVKRVSIAVGSSAPRYYLASSAFGPMAGYAALLVELHSKDSTKAVEERFNSYARSNYPNLIVKSSLFKVSPVPEASIEIGFLGENIDTLISLTDRVKEIMLSDEGVDQVRDSWGNKVAYLTPRYSTSKGGRLGVSRQMMSQSYAMINSGTSIGSFGKDDTYLPIMLKSDAELDFNLNDVANIPIIASGGRSFPLSAVTSAIEYDYSYYSLRRYNHSPVMYAQCEPIRGGNTAAAFNRIYAQAKEIELPEGYTLKIKGERDSQDESNAALAENMPLTLILIFITLLFLFRGYKKPMVILSMIPLIFIGVVLGLVVTGKMFDFFCILGLLGLIGMNIKNAVVLVEQIGVESSSGKSPIDAIVTSAKSRLLPVTMASGTTIVGMMPLLADAMFGGMAATIMGGLFIATLLTMFILPVAYAIFFKVKNS